MTMVAEGIEETGQLDRLLALGCELGQGYLFARPARAEDIGALLGVEPASSREAGQRAAKGSAVASSGRRRTMAIDAT